jgi:HEAT repeat protein
LLDDKDPSVRYEALNSLGRFNDPKIVDAAIRLLSDTDIKVKLAALRIMEEHPDVRSVDKLIALLNDQNMQIVREAIIALGSLKDGSAVEPLIRILNDEHRPSLNRGGYMHEIKSRTADALGNIGDKRAVPHLIYLLDTSELIRPAARALGALQDRRAVPALMSIYGSVKPYVRFDILNALASIADPETIKFIAKSVGENENLARSTIPLRDHKDTAIEDNLLEYLNNDSKVLKKGAILILGRLRNQDALEPLEKMLNDNDPDIRSSAKKAVMEIRSYGTKSNVTGAPKRSRYFAAGYSSSGYPVKSRAPVKRGTARPSDKSSRIISSVSGREFKRDRNIRDKAQTQKTYNKPVRYTVPEQDHNIRTILPQLESTDVAARREAADRLGDSGQKDAGRHLVPLLKDRDPYVRQAAARALGKLNYREAADDLIESLKDHDEYVRVYSSKALGEFDDVHAVEPLLDALHDEDRKVKDRSKEGLTKLKKNPDVLNLLFNLLREAFRSEDYSTIGKLVIVLNQKDIIEAFKDTEGDDRKTVHNYATLLESNYSNLSGAGEKGLREFKDRSFVITELSSLIKSKTAVYDNAVHFLRKLNDPETIPVFIYILEHRQGFSAWAKSNAVDMLAALNQDGSVKLIIEVLKDPHEDSRVRNHAARALGKRGVKESAITLIDILKNKNELNDVRKGSAIALGEIGDERAVQPLINVLNDDTEDIWLRIASASALGNIGDEKAIAPLQKTFKGPSDHLKHAAEIALRKF